MNTRRGRRDVDRVQHILDAAAKPAEIVAEGKEVFDTSWRQRLLAERLLIILGEAGRSLSKESVAAHPALEVVGARGMRNFLVHEYDDVDPELVWQAITTSVPGFVEALDADAPSVDPTVTNNEPGPAV